MADEILRIQLPAVRPTTKWYVWAKGRIANWGNVRIASVGIRTQGNLEERKNWITWCVTNTYYLDWAAWTQDGGVLPVEPAPEPAA